MSDDTQATDQLAGKLKLPVMGEIVGTPEGDALVQGIANAADINWTPKVLSKVSAHTAGRLNEFALLHVKILASNKETTYPSWQVTRRQATKDRAPWREGLIQQIGSSYNQEPQG
jgi:hypothetical protein